MISQHVVIASIDTEVVRIELCGEIDGACAAEVADRVGALVAAGAHLEIDLSRTTFLDTDGAAPLIRAAEIARTHDDELRVVAWSRATEHLRAALTRVCTSET